MSSDQSRDDQSGQDLTEKQSSELLKIDHSKSSMESGSLTQFIQNNDQNEHIHLPITKKIKQSSRIQEQENDPKQPQLKFHQSYKEDFEPIPNTNIETQKEKNNNSFNSAKKSSKKSKLISDNDNETESIDDSAMDEEEEDCRRNSGDHKQLSGGPGNSNSHNPDWRANPRKKWGQGTIQQCKHKNIFKNFGNIIIKYFKESDEFKTETSRMFGNFEKLAFYDWVYKEIKLESKKDFIKGWVEQSDDDEQIAVFKQQLRRMSHYFLTKKGVEFLKKSRMKHKEIHLRSLKPLIDCAIHPHYLKQFKPEETNMEFEASKLRSDY